MYRIALLFIFLLVAQPGIAQENIISVSTYGVVELPADIIQFNINLNAEADSPQQAYDLHNERERVLVQALKKHQIPEKDIRFQPVSIRSIHTDQFTSDMERKKVYRTDQQVSLGLSDFDIYEQIQITLIENGFDSFSGNFRSSKQESGEEDALRKAIREARSKAEIIASEAGAKLGSIKQIRYSQQQVYPVSQMESRAMAADQPRLMEYEQSVAVRANVDIDFYIDKD